MDDATKQYWDDYYSHPRFNKTTETGMPPTVQSAVSATMAPSSVSQQPVPPGQWGTDTEAGQVLRGVGIAANQAGIGALGIPMGALRLGWSGLHALDPSGFNEPPAWTAPSGPGSYGEGLTYDPLTPSTPAERILASGARSTGTALTMMPFGMGPVAVGVNALGGFGGGALTEAGHPYLGAAVEAGAGLASGFGTAAKATPIMGGTPMWSNVPHTAATAARTAAEARAAQEAADVSALRRMEMWSPLTHSMPFGSGVLLNLALSRMGAMQKAGANSAAQRVLGIGMGAGVGAESAYEDYRPPISYAAPASFAPPGGFVPGGQ